jgi:GAF domain-containing protein
MGLSLSHEFATCADPAAVASLALAHALDVMHTGKGNVQLAAGSDPAALRIVIQRGFAGPDSIDCIRRVSRHDQAGCSRAFLARRVVVIEDVARDYEDAALRELALCAGYRSAQSTPILSESGALFGVLSTHDALPRRPTDQQLAAVRSIAEAAGNALAALGAQRRPGPSRADDPADQELVEKIAANFIRHWGMRATEELRERASIASVRKDALSERAWLDVADAAGALLGED